MAPLIYSLIRSSRPRSVLEIGAGYTTLFALQALADNLTDEAAERKLLAGAGADPRQRAAHALRRRLPFALREHYDVPYNPRMVAIDRWRDAPVVAARRLGLDRLLTFFQTDFRGCSGGIDRSVLPFDFVFLDCGGQDNYRDFMDEYWPLVNPAGGLLLVHSTLTNREGLAFLKGLKSRQGKDREGEFELLNLLEPHKMQQNSATMLRKTTGDVEVIYTEGP